MFRKELPHEAILPPSSPRHCVHILVQHVRTCTWFFKNLKRIHYVQKKKLSFLCHICPTTKSDLLKLMDAIKIQNPSSRERDKMCYIFCGKYNVATEASIE